MVSRPVTAGRQTIQPHSRQLPPGRGVQWRGPSRACPHFSGWPSGSRISIPQRTLSPGSLPRSCPSTTPLSLISQGVLGQVKSDVMPTASPALGWGPARSLPSHTPPSKEVSEFSIWLERQPGGHPTLPMPQYNPSATYKIAFPACLQHEATARGEAGSLWAQQLAISSLDTGFS